MAKQDPESAVVYSAWLVAKNDMKKASKVTAQISPTTPSPSFYTKALALLSKYLTSPTENSFTDLKTSLLSLAAGPKIHALLAICALPICSLQLLHTLEATPTFVSCVASLLPSSPRQSDANLYASQCPTNGDYRVALLMYTRAKLRRKARELCDARPSLWVDAVQVAPEMRSSADWRARRWLANFGETSGWESEALCARIRENPFV